MAKQQTGEPTVEEVLVATILDAYNGGPGISMVTVPPGDPFEEILGLPRKALIVIFTDMGDGELGISVQPAS